MVKYRTLIKIYLKINDTELVEQDNNGCQK
jgi:hypothetical protein